jgi:hypothetical protein
MNVACIPISFNNPSFLSTSTGVSEAAEKLNSMINRVLQDCSRSVTIDKDSLFQELDEVFEECSVDNWDGYDAKPINVKSQIEAIRFARNLPTTIPTPEIAADPDGEISFEWYEGPRRVLTVSIGSHNKATYAGLFGLNKVNGEESFYDEIPKAILDNLNRLFHSYI